MSGALVTAFKWPWPSSSASLKYQTKAHWLARLERVLWINN